MSYLETRKNDYGTPVDAYRCETCGEEFTVCPAHADRSSDDQWAGCQAVTCGSYDPARDADKLFDNGNVLSFDQRKRPGLIQRRPI